VLDDNGSISISLPCTDTAGLSPLNFWYRVIEQITGYVREYAIQLPHTLGATVDLSALATSTSPPAISALATSNTWTGTQTFGGNPAIVLMGDLAPAVVTLSQSGGAVPVNAALGNDFRLTLTASGWTIANPANPTDGQIIQFSFAQDSTGSRAISWGSSYDFGIMGSPALSTAASKVDLIGFKYHAGLSKWLCLGAGLGF
jgi:hypothetical protein